MKTFTQDSNGDIFMDTSTMGLSMSNGIDAYCFIVKNAIMTVLGEIQLNESLGIDYFNTIFNNVNAVPNWRNDVAKRILEIDFVKSIKSMEVDINSNKRTLSYTIVIVTDIGEVTVAS